MPRIQILTPAEYATFEMPPTFTNLERQRFFNLSQSLLDLITTFRTPTNQIGFVVTLGYFLATKRFFARQFHEVDVAYVARQLGFLPGVFEVAEDCLHARYLFKYFGADEGVSAYTFIDMRNFLYHSLIISSAEHEAHYVIDGVMRNDVVKSEIHSTDTGGYSEILFGAMRLLGFAFAPRIKNFAQCKLYAFNKRKEYQIKGYKILPSAYIKEELITPQWDEILRFIATIKLKEATASQLFRRLNSYSRQHPLYTALKEFGKIPKSNFLLRYTDILQLRQTIEKQLNKGENANKFSRAVSFGNNQEFLSGEKIEQEIAEGCRRLIKNAIICWNYLYFTQKIIEAESEELKQELLTSIRNGSVVTWKHINLHGEYNFSDEKLQDSVGLNAPEILAMKEI